MRRRSSAFKVQRSKFSVWSIVLEMFGLQLFTRLKGLGLILFLMVNFGVLNAQIETRLDPQVILIGDTASLQITITADARQKIILPQVGDSINNYIEITNKKTDSLKRGNNLNIIQNYTITCFEPGEFLVNALPYSIDGKIIQSTSQILVVQDLEVDADATKMFPIKPIMPEDITLWEKYKKYFWYFVIALILAFITGLIIWLYFKEKKNKKYVSTPLLPPYEEALDNLRKLDKAKLLESQKYYEYYSDLSFIIRRYFTRRFEFPANALLSEDLPQALLNKDLINETESAELAEFLKDADLAKYARTTPSAEKHGKYRDWIENLIYKTRPVLEEDIPENLRQEDEEKLRKIDNR